MKPVTKTNSKKIGKKAKRITQRGRGKSSVDSFDKMKPRSKSKSGLTFRSRGYSRSSKDKASKQLEKDAPNPPSMRFFKNKFRSKRTASSKRVSEIDIDDIQVGTSLLMPETMNLYVDIPQDEVKQSDLIKLDIDSSFTVKRFQGHCCEDSEKDFLKVMRLSRENQDTSLNSVTVPVPIPKKEPERKPRNLKNNKALEKEKNRNSIDSGVSIFSSGSNLENGSVIEDKDL